MKASKAATSHDILRFVSFGQLAYGGLSTAECHALGFLCRMVFAYDNDDTDRWGYEFSTTKTGAPYSIELQDSIDWLLDAAFLRSSAGFLVTTRSGAAMLSSLEGLPDVLERRRYVDSACGACAVLPLPTVIEALFHDPQLRVSAQSSESRELFTDLADVVLRQSLESVAIAISDVERRDAFQATAVYLQYLSTIARAADAA